MGTTAAETRRFKSYYNEIIRGSGRILAANKSLAHSFYFHPCLSVCLSVSPGNRDAFCVTVLGRNGLLQVLQCIGFLQLEEEIRMQLDGIGKEEIRKILNLPS